ncbi:MAG: hypothetical protein LR015_01950, partial [Verrucomicrobia bacterium]|nr:hypothetical protein [Verrucomicrobiota bacterium]
LNYRVNSELKVGSDIFHLEPNTWYTLAVRWDMDLGANAMSWYVVDMDRGIADAGVRSPSVVGDSTYRYGLQAAFHPIRFSVSLQNIAVYDRALSETALLDMIQFFRADNPALLTTIQDSLPGAFWVGPGNLFSHPSIGRFTTSAASFPMINHPNFGELILVDGTRQPSVYLYSMALDSMDCVTPFGWIVMHPQALPSFIYSPATDSWNYAPDTGSAPGQFWIYDMDDATWSFLWLPIIQAGTHHHESPSTKIYQIQPPGCIHSDQFSVLQLSRGHGE